jgi:transposase
MHVEPHHDMETLEQLEQQEERRTERLRVQLVLLAKQGHSAPVIGAKLGLSHRQVVRWVSRYNSIGSQQGPEAALRALSDRPRAGRSPRLKPEHEEAFRRFLEERLPEQERREPLRGEDIRDILRERYEVELTLSGVHRMMRRLGRNGPLPDGSFIVRSRRQKQFDQKAS